MGEIGIAGHRAGRGYVNRPDLTEQRVHPRLPGHPEQPVGADLPDRRPRPDQRRRRDRAPRPHRHPGQDPRLPDRADRDRVGAAAGARRSRRRWSPRTSPGRAWWSWPRTTPAPRRAPPVDAARVHAHLRERLPAYMVPAYLEELPSDPDAAQRQGGPQEPAARRPARGHRPPRHHAAPATGTEWALAETLAAMLGLDRVSAEADFFDELGASSLLMARFIAALPDGTDGVDAGHLPEPDRAPPRRRDDPATGATRRRRRAATRRPGRGGDASASGVTPASPSASRALRCAGPCSCWSSRA